MNWSKHFDHIYCFHFIQDKDRYRTVQDELRRVGILDSGIFSFVYTSVDPWERFVEQEVQRIWTNHASNRGFVNLGLATARTFREADYLGYDRVLFLEDDVRFLKDLDEAQRILDSTPADYDLVQYDKFPLWGTKPEDYRDFVAEHDINGRFFDACKQTVASGACFMANRSARMSMLFSLEMTQPRPVDGLFGLFKFKRCCATKNIAVQESLPDSMMKGYLEQASVGKADSDDASIHDWLYGKFGTDVRDYNLMGDK